MASDVTAAQVVMLYCTKHTTEEMDMYCHQCKKATCTTCMTEYHLGHKMDTIAKYSRKLTNNRERFLGDLTATYDLKSRRKTRQFREVKCHNDFVLSNNVNTLEERREHLHRVVDELIDKELNTCKSHNTELTEDFEKVEKKHIDEDGAIEKMLTVFEKTSMTGFDIIEYYEDLKARVDSMDSDVDVTQFVDRLLYRKGDVDKIQMQGMVGNTKEAALETPSPIQLSAFCNEESTVRYICPVSRGTAWVTFGVNKQFLLINKDGQQLDSMTREAENAGFFVTDDNSIITCNYHKQVVQRIVHSGETTNITNTSPLRPVSVGKALNGNILVTLVDVRSRSRTAESQRKVVMLTPVGDVLHEYEFGEDGSTPLLSFPMRPTQNYNSNVCVINVSALDTGKYQGQVCVFYEDGGLKFVYSSKTEEFYAGTFAVTFCLISCVSIDHGGNRLKRDLFGGIW